LAKLGMTVAIVSRGWLISTGTRPTLINTAFLHGPNHHRRFFMKAIKHGAALALVLISSCAIAQNSKSSGNNSSDPNKQDPLTMQGSAPDDWTMLKGHEKGYVSKEDAQPNSWLAQNFKSCDKDNDGKLTQDEYTKCEKMKTMGGNSGSNK
jgi:hypothetical protein